MDLHVYNTLILSDLHLGAETSHAREATRVLKENRFQRLILLGDIFADLNFARLTKDHWKFLGYIRKLSCPIWWVCASTKIIRGIIVACDTLRFTGISSMDFK
jgi:metallophosphoesterase superfamily enzyme